jgi:hypothetical protein
MNGPEANKPENQNEHSSGFCPCPQCSSDQLQTKWLVPHADLGMAKRSIEKQEYKGLITEDDTEAWFVRLECPNCETPHTALYGRTAIDAYEDAYDEEQAKLVDLVEEVTRENMLFELSKVVTALEADVICPEDIQNWRRDPAADYEHVRLHSF